jgi:hypothetical protein
VTLTTFFLFGAARSGTNAITWALEGSDHISVKNEDSPDCFDQFVLKDTCAIKAVLKESAPKPVFFKSFHDTPRARSLFQLYPDARAIYSIRQPGDCIGSFVNEFGKAGADLWVERFRLAAKERGGLLLHVCRDDPVAAEIAVDRARFVLNELDSSGASISNTAACYYLWAHSFADHIGILDDRRYLVMDYDAMVADPQAAIDRTCRHFSIDRISTDADSWFSGRQFGKTIDVAPRLLALCQEVYEGITACSTN